MVFFSHANSTIAYVCYPFTISTIYFYYTSMRSIYIYIQYKNNSFIPMAFENNHPIRLLSSITLYIPTNTYNVYRKFY